MRWSTDARAAIPPMFVFGSLVICFNHTDCLLYCSQFTCTACSFFASVDGLSIFLTALDIQVNDSQWERKAPTMPQTLLKDKAMVLIYRWITFFSLNLCYFGKASFFDRRLHSFDLRFCLLSSCGHLYGTWSFFLAWPTTNWQQKSVMWLIPPIFLLLPCKTIK